MSDRSAQTATLTESRSTTFAAAAFAVLLGMFLVYGAALAQPDALHHAAHDARHAFAFPCH